tara:strand:+ start:378 stop:1190 length:813 start_codon:yes stop_codon:yes gene_type:complete
VEINHISSLSKNVRKNILKAALEAGSASAHIGGALSSVEIVSTLYSRFISFPEKKNWHQRDRFILSKGHACLVLYSVLLEKKLITEKEFSTFEKNNSILPGHPVINKFKGIEFSNGSLGLGLSLAIGTAVALKKKNKKNKVYVLLGDGECNEGSVWEAALLAPNLNLNNLTCIIDKNNFQQTGSSNEILNTEDLSFKWKSFNWEVIEVNGHEIKELINALETETSKPKLIIAKTIKGKGLNFAENNNEWHHKILTKKLYDEAIKNLNNND